MHRSGTVVALLAALLAAALAAPSARAQLAFELPEETIEHDPARPAAGRWIGSIDASGTPVFVDLALEHGSEAGWSATATIMPLGAVGAKATTVEIDGRDVEFELASPIGRVRFEGTVAEDGQRLRGTAAPLDDDDEPMPFELARTLAVMDLPGARAYTGRLAVPQMGELEITVALGRTPGGRWLAHLDVPAQSLVGFPLVNVERDEEGRVTADGSVPVPLSIDARIEESGAVMRGRFSQGPIELPLELRHDPGYAGPTIARPQHPEPPFPYEVREITVPHADGHRLAGTLTIPRGEGPFPAAVLVTGSGPQDRDETIFGHKPFLVIADHLARHGIAALRCDDRGVGASTGSFAGATTRDLATDVWAAFEVLRREPGVDPARIGLVGHSEGGLIAPLVAADHDDVAFIVLLAGVGVPGGELLKVQIEKLLEVSGLPEAEREPLLEQQRRYLDMVARGRPVEELRAVLEPLIEAQLEKTGIEGDVGKEVVEAQLEQLTSDWMLELIRLDPRPALERVECPVLAMNGTLDLQVWHEQNLPAIEKAVRAGGGDVTIRRYEGLNHLFQPARTGSIAEYGEIEITFDETVLHDVSEWILATVGDGAAAATRPE